MYNQQTNRQEKVSHTKYSVQIKWKNEREKVDAHVYGQCISIEILREIY